MRLIYADKTILSNYIKLILLEKQNEAYVPVTIYFVHNAPGVIRETHPKATPGTVVPRAATAVCTRIASTLGKSRRALTCEREKEMNRARAGLSLAEPVGRYSTTEVQKRSLTFQEV